MMLNMFRKVSFFFFSGRFLSQHILAFKHCPYTHTQVHTHTGTHTQISQRPSSFFLCCNVTANSEHQERSSESLTGVIVK